MTSTINPGRVEPPADSQGAPTPHFRVAVIGTGFSGLGTAIRLKQQGIDDFVVFERAGEVGGTWRDNSYPGCAGDIMSLLYSFSFAPNTEWKTTFATRDELLAYLKDCTAKYGVREHILFDHEVTGAEWDERGGRWHVRAGGRAFTAQVLVAGAGYLSDAKLPDIDGLDSFTGELFHSSNWNHDVDLKGKRVAVIGTGSSAIQIVPAIQPEVGQLHVHQRTPGWVLPKNDKVIGKLQLALRRGVPGYQRFRRGFNKWGREIVAFWLARPKAATKTLQGMAEKNLKKNVKDEALRARLTPDFTVGCKRMLFSNDWYPTLEKDNVELVTDGITRVEGNTVVTADGTRREVDVIVAATGFSATDRPIAHRILGRGGVSLAQTWAKDGMTAYVGSTVAGFPNLFLILGPNTVLAHSSVTLTIEGGINHTIDALKAMDKRGLATLEVKPEAQTAYNAELQQRFDGTVWAPGGCQSWYIGEHETNPSVFPTYSWRFLKQTKKVDLTAYTATTGVATPVVGARSTGTGPR